MRIYSILADVIVVLHVAYVAFVIFGLLAIWIGILLRAQWIRNFWFRILHLSMILIVVLEAWARIVCPLTTWEQTLRRKAGQESYQGDFIGKWAHDLLFIDISPTTFTLMYTLFGLGVLGTFLIAPPQLPHRKPTDEPRRGDSQ